MVRVFLQAAFLLNYLRNNVEQWEQVEQDLTWKWVRRTPCHRMCRWHPLHFQFCTVKVVLGARREQRLVRTFPATDLQIYREIMSSLLAVAGSDSLQVTIKLLPPLHLSTSCSCHLVIIKLLPSFSHALTFPLPPSFSVLSSPSVHSSSGSSSSPTLRAGLCLNLAG